MLRNTQHNLFKRLIQSILARSIYKRFRQLNTTVPTSGHIDLLTVLANLSKIATPVLT